MPDLPLVIGPRANQRSQDLARLLASASRLTELLAGATWVGNRRCALRFRTAATLSLPDGEDEAKAAPSQFSPTSAPNPLLWLPPLRLDLRPPATLPLPLPP